jgi:hypothetical protein
MATGVLRARAMEGGGEGVESLPEDDVVLRMTLVGVEGSCTGGSTGSRAAAALEAHRHCGEGSWDARKQN